MAKLDHVNIQTTQLADTVAFYAEIIGLEVRDPPELDPKLVQWMYDEGGKAILHISTVGSLLGEDGVELGTDTGAVHHVALDCAGHDAMVAKLDARRLPYRLNHVKTIDLKQIFVHDPNGVLIELNYFKHRQ
jgi:catechol 2,3-dioxygenase-like lactoylglutathione lyase family enzyme